MTDADLKALAEQCIYMRDNSCPVFDIEKFMELTRWDGEPNCAAKDYVDRAIASFAHDPPDNNFQKGYLAALEVVRDEAFDARKGASRLPLHHR